MSDEGPPLHPAGAGDKVCPDDDPVSAGALSGAEVPGALGDSALIDGAPSGAEVPSAALSHEEALTDGALSGAEAPSALGDSAPLSDEQARGAEAAELAPRSISAKSALPTAPGLSLMTAALALLATLIARLLAMALPGARAHLEQWIRLTDVTSAFLSQATLAAGSIAVSVLLISTLRLSALSVAYRLTAAVLGAGALTVLTSTFRYSIREESLLVLALCTALLGTWSSYFASKSPHTRGSALVLLMASACSVLQVIARALARYASDNALPSLFDAARTVATLGLVIDVLALFIACLWLARPSPRRAAVPLLVAAVLATLITLASLSGSKPDASLFEVLASRVTAELTLHPSPWLLDGLRGWIALFGFGVVGAALLSPNGRLPAIVVALALLARGATDTPIYALCLLLAALLAPVAALGFKAQAEDELPVAAD